MGDNREPIFARTLNVQLSFETYKDPEQEASHFAVSEVTYGGAHICGCLFWAVRHLAHHAQHSGLAFNESDFFETMQTIGQVGYAIAQSVCEGLMSLNASRSS
jgi:hypothetical protein